MWSRWGAWLSTRRRRSRLSDGVGRESRRRAPRVSHFCTALYTCLLDFVKYESPLTVLNSVYINCAGACTASATPPPAGAPRAGHLTQRNISQHSPLSSTWAPTAPRPLTPRQHSKSHARVITSGYRHRQQPSLVALQSRRCGRVSVCPQERRQLSGSARARAAPHGASSAPGPGPAARLPLGCPSRPRPHRTYGAYHRPRAPHTLAPRP